MEQTNKDTQLIYEMESAFIALVLPFTIGALVPPVANAWWSIGIIAAILGGKFASILVIVALIGSYASVAFLIYKSVRYAFQIIDR